MVEDGSSDRAKEKAKKNFEELSMGNVETTINPIGQDIPVICLHLEDTTNNPASF